MLRLGCSEQVHESGGLLRCERLVSPSLPRNLRRRSRRVLCARGALIVLGPCSRARVAVRLAFVRPARLSRLACCVPDACPRRGCLERCRVFRAASLRAPVAVRSASAQAAFRRTLSSHPTRLDMALTSGCKGTAHPPRARTLNRRRSGFAGPLPATIWTLSLAGGRPSSGGPPPELGR
jgi:hypothetical protein